MRKLIQVRPYDKKKNLRYGNYIIQLWKFTEF